MTYRIALIDQTGRAKGYLRYHNGKAEWPTGSEVRGDLFDRDAAHDLAGKWNALLAAMGAPYSVSVIDAWQGPTAAH